MSRSILALMANSFGRSTDQNMEALGRQGISKGRSSKEREPDDSVKAREEDEADVGEDQPGGLQSQVGDVKELLGHLSAHVMM